MHLTVVPFPLNQEQHVSTGQSTVLYGYISWYQPSMYPPCRFREDNITVWWCQPPCTLYTHHHGLRARRDGKSHSSSEINTGLHSPGQGIWRYLYKLAKHVGMHGLSMIGLLISSQREKAGLMHAKPTLPRYPRHLPGTWIIRGTVLPYGLLSWEKSTPWQPFTHKTGPA